MIPLHMSIVNFTQSSFILLELWLQSTIMLHACILCAEIVESPSDVTVFINQSAEFKCVTHGALLYHYWKFNGTSLLSLPLDTLNDLVATRMPVEDNVKFTLIIPGRSEYNGTSLECVAGGEGNEKESQTASLNIQGTLVVYIAFASYYKYNSHILQ